MRWITPIYARHAKQVRKLADGYDSPRQCYVDKIAEGVATIAAAFSPALGYCALVGL